MSNIDISIKNQYQISILTKWEVTFHLNIATQRWKLSYFLIRFPEESLMGDKREMTDGDQCPVLLKLCCCAADLVHGEEPEEHRAWEQDDWGAEWGPVHGTVWSEPRADPQPGQHPPAAHGELIWKSLKKQNI